MPIVTIGLLLEGILYATPPKNDSERLIRELTQASFGKVYFEDGAADGSVTDRTRVTALAGQKVFASVESILDLKGRAIPLLIEHLDDQQPTLAKFNGRPAALGHIVLDILTHIVSGDQVFIADCRDDSLGACIKPDYYFGPDANPNEMRKVKTH